MHARSILVVATLLAQSCTALPGSPATPREDHEPPANPHDSDGDDPSDGDGDGDEGDRPGEPGCDIQEVMARPENGCTSAGCHGAQYQGGLDLLSPGLEERLAGAFSQTEACAGEPLVDPEDVERSLLLRLIDPARFAADPCGVMMPLGTTTGVSADTLACFESFVSSLSPGDDPEPEPEPDPEFATADSYVNKVKTLLTGRAATDAEIQRVVDEPAALKALVASWVDAPEFETKLADFLRGALQQRLDGSLAVTITGQRGPRLAALRENLEESFVRTAALIVAENRPFTEILTTRRWQVTTATLMALAYLDETSSRLRNVRHTVLPGSGADSIAERIWHVPSAPDTCRPQSPLRSDQMIDLMLGIVPCAGAGAMQHRFTDTLLTDADFADWRTVELVKVNTSVDVPLFWDVPRLRSLSRMSLVVPRVGFFSAPAFLENWETNEDNQFRVTTSQALIVALGEIFSPADPTVPVRLDGLAKEHAAPGTTCRGCHQFIDPMRIHFARNFSYVYNRPETPSTVTPSFAFHGVTRDGGALGDFATTLAQHPDFAPGWTQKLCYWANSQPCDAGSAEFERVAAAFKASGHRFETLLVELLSSPLVTFAAPIEAEQEGFVSITRRQHLCQLLDVRLGVDTACDLARNLAQLIPDDDYSRGAAEPVQTAVTGLFHHAAAEKLCMRLSTLLVGGAETRFPVAAPEAALDALVADLMGLGAGHARAATARESLGAHYERARAATNTQAALRSAFVMACMAPEVMAVGL